VAAVYHFTGEFNPGWIDVTWQAPADTGGIGVYWYLLEHKTDAGPWTAVSPVEGYFLIRTLNGIFAGGQTKSFRVRAWNDWGLSEYSGIASCVAEAP
jgi:hypothetical protein